MAPRTRRAASQKQSQYRIVDEDEDARICTTPVKQKVGGVLASLSHNVPLVKSRKKKGGEEISKTETIESSGVSIFKTPPPPSSVFVGNNNELCSPLTQPRVGNGGRPTSSAADKSVDDNTTALSCETFSPVQKRSIHRKAQKASNKYAATVDDDDSEEIGSVDEDDDTAEMDEHDDDQDIDPNETLLEGESSEENDDEIESAEDDSEEDIELETEDDEEDYEPDDEEYVPDEEEESGLDEELDSYVEEEKENTKARSRSHKSKQALVQSQPTTTESKLGTSANPDASHDAEDQFSISHDITTFHDSDTNSFCLADNCGQVAVTPSKSEAMPNCLESSPEPAMAVIVDDDDDSDDDVLVATILDDEEEDGNRTIADETVQTADEENDDGAASFIDEASSGQHVNGVCDSPPQPSSEGKSEKKETTRNIELNNASLMNDGKHTVSEVNKMSIAPSAHAPQPSSDGMSFGDVVVITQPHVPEIPPESEMRLATEVELDYKATPQKTARKARKSFFRTDGMVKRGKWKLGSKIGVGSFGVVHVGMNNETGKLMAVKKFKVDEAVMQDIRREVELMKSLNHPNIVRYLGAEMDKTHLHIFQEWVPGGSVATLLARFGPFSLSVIRSYLSQTLSGLAYLHENDIMHRDIKGSNILVNDEGVVKLADFGASKKLSNLRDNMMMSLTVRGTPYFMSPEVFEEKYSAKADIWGIGCVAYQMITGSPPWKDKGFSNPISLFNYIKRHKGPPKIDDEHKERLLNEDRNIFNFLHMLLECCFSKDPMSRPDATDLIQHQFFTEMHQDADDDSICSRGLFSPVSVFRSTPNKEDSPEEASQMLESPSPSHRCPPVPTPVSHGRSKSVVQWRTTFSSPPRQKNSRPSTTKNKVMARPSSSSGSPYNSPKPDVNNWPDWARAEVEKRTLFDKSPNKEVISPVTQDTNLSAMMGSLALSEDSGAASNNPYRRVSKGRISTIGTTADESKLVGLSLLNESNITYEI